MILLQNYTENSCKNEGAIGGLIAGTYTVSHSYMPFLYANQEMFVNWKDKHNEKLDAHAQIYCV